MFKVNAGAGSQGIIGHIIDPAKSNNEPLLFDTWEKAEQYAQRYREKGNSSIGMWFQIEEV